MFLDRSQDAARRPSGEHGVVLLASLSTRPRCTIAIVPFGYFWQALTGRVASPRCACLHGEECSTFSHSRAARELPDRFRDGCGSLVEFSASATGRRSREVLIASEYEPRFPSSHLVGVLGTTPSMYSSARAQRECLASFAGGFRSSNIRMRSTCCEPDVRFRNDDACATHRYRGSRDFEAPRLLEARDLLGTQGKSGPGQREARQRRRSSLSRSPGAAGSAMRFAERSHAARGGNSIGRKVRLFVTTAPRL